MISPLRPPDDEERVAALRDLNLLDTPQEEKYDRIIRQLAERLDAPIAYLALIDRDRQWLKSMVGGMSCETGRDASFCGHTILDEGPLIVPDATRDPRFDNNPMVVGEPFIRFYAGMPLISAGRRVGTLCVADRRPRHLSDADSETLKQFARLVEAKMNARPKVFISYSHRDGEWKDRLVEHLAVLQRQDLLNVWDDRRIGSGEGWKDAIQDALESSSVAILLVSANLLTSQFVMDVEVPQLLRRRDSEGLRILPVLIKPCCWDRVGWLEPMNLFPRGAQPLSGESEHAVDLQLAELTGIVMKKIAEPPAAPLPPPPMVAAPGSPTDLASAAAPGLKLKVESLKGTAKSESYMFRQRRISIGRKPSCDLPLVEELPVISGVHAEIVADGDRLLLMDLGSKNFTYLNEARLEPHRAYQIQPSDIVQVGEFELTIESVEGRRAPSTLDSTVFDPGYVNPFKDDVRMLADVLRSLVDAYDREAPTRRDDALKEILTATLGGHARHQAFEVLARFLGDGHRR